MTKRFWLLSIVLPLLASTSSAQITSPDQNQPQEGQQGWVQINSPTTTTIDWLGTQPNGTIWISDDNNTYRSKDLGETWWKHEALGLVFPNFFNDLEGVAGTPNGDALVTIDGGETWQMANPTELKAAAPFVVQPHFVFAIDFNSGISKSTDKGRTWYKRQVDGFMGPIHFCDTLNGITVGDPPSMDFGLGHRTTNGGETWSKLKLPPYYYQGVYMLSVDTILMVSTNGHVFRSTDKGASWEKQTLTPIGEGLDAITFTTHKEGYVAGIGGVIFQTTDAGTIWHQQLTPTKVRLETMQFINDSVGFASGEQGVLLRTSNKGKSWVQLLPKQSPIVVHTYPEPFSTSVKLSYKLDKPCPVAVSVYSISGQKMTDVTVNKQLPGENTVTINAAGWPPGVYLYTLHACDYTASGRITLVPQP